MAAPHTERFVLLVDDEEVVLEVFRRTFKERHGFLLDPTNNLKDALDKVAVFAYDALILDMAFPEGGDGMEILRAVRYHEMDNYAWRQRLMNEARLLGGGQFVSMPQSHSSAFILTGSITPRDLLLDARAMGIRELIVKPTEFTEPFAHRVIDKISVDLGNA